VDTVNTIQEHLDSIEEGLPFAIETYEAYKAERILEVSRHASVNMHHLIHLYYLLLILSLQQYAHICNEWARNIILNIEDGRTQRLEEVERWYDTLFAGV